MASKNVKREISYNCLKCGKVTVYSLMNIKDILKGNTKEKIYRCNICGHKISK